MPRCHEGNTVGHRLSRIYTRTGDGGETGLGDGSRVPKDDPRIDALGCVDELNSHIGVLLAESIPDDIRTFLERVQHDLFDLGGELSIPGYTLLSDASIEALERELDRCNAGLPALKEFILPGGTRAAAAAHVARTVCRRAERAVVGLQRTGAAGPTGLRYLNRLSDLLFVLARMLNKAAGAPDVQWQRRPPGS
jgi:cob(I)alamin adenosyltransferase